MEKLQGLIREYGDNLIKQLQKVPDGLAHIEPWITNRRENYASAVAAYIMSYLYWKEGASRYLECFSGLIKHSVSLLKKENTKTSSFAKVFILNYSLMAILTLPEKERKVYTNLTLNEFESFKDECPAINTNCAALQYGNEIFLSCMNSERKNIFFLDCLLNHVEKSQNYLGFINDSCGEGEQDSDGMPIAYHMFICYLLLNVLLMNGQYHVLPIGHGERVRNIISAGIKWLTYATFETGDVAMAERSRYQVFTMGVQAALTAVSFPEKVECVVDQLIHQYGFDQNASHCTPNNFPPSMRVGYENYTRTNDYNNLNIAGFITSDLCLELGMRILRDDVISDKRLFCDADSGYAFYRNEYGFMGIVLRNHTGGYLSQGTGFHYRLKKCQLPLAEPTDNAVGTISEAVKIKGSLSDVCGGGYAVCSEKNAIIEEIYNGVQIRYGNDSFRVDKKINILEKSIIWNYFIIAKRNELLSDCKFIFSVPLVVDNGKSALKIVTEINHGIIFQFQDLLYALEYDEAGSGMFDTELSLASVSGVSANFVVSLRQSEKDNNRLGCSIKLTLIEDEEMGVYNKAEIISESYAVDLPAGLIDNCVGCGVCAKVCPQKCIIMQRDPVGFLYPVINLSKCIRCNSCNKKCPVNNKPITNSFTRPFVYAAYSCREKHRKKGSSGGIFRELAEGILQNEGYVYAAKYDPFPTVSFSRTDSVESIHLFYGSKYVESELKDVFVEIRKELNVGKRILFVGLPCQVAALLCFLEKGYSNLYTVDFVCGGVASPFFFRIWIYALEESYKESIVNYKVRNKAMGLPDRLSSIVFSSGKERFIEKSKDVFFQDYQKGYNVRKGCFSCQFYGLNSVADITIGDFNGASNYDWIKDEIYNGVSVLCVNSEKGNTLLQMCKGNVVLKETNFIVASRYNYRMRSRRTEPDKREEYIKTVKLFNEKIKLQFSPNSLCFYQLESPSGQISLRTLMRWVVYVQGTKEIEYAWYLYHNGNRIHVEWYNEKNSYEYIPEETGEYYVSVFAKYKDDQDKIYMNSQKVIVI